MAGLIFVPLGLGFSLATARVPALTAALGARLLALGALTMALGALALIATVDIAGGRPAGLALAPALVIHGVGQAFLIAPLINTVLARVAARDAGAAAGVLLTMQQVAAALGVAVIGAIFIGHLGRPAPAGADAAARHYAAAFTTALLATIGLSAATVILVFLLPAPRAAASEPSGEAA